MSFQLAINCEHNPMRILHECVARVKNRMDIDEVNWFTAHNDGRPK